MNVILYNCSLVLPLSSYLLSSSPLQGTEVRKYRSTKVILKDQSHAIMKTLVIHQVPFITWMLEKKSEKHIGLTLEIIN